MDYIWDLTADKHVQWWIYRKVYGLNMHMGETVHFRGVIDRESVTVAGRIKWRLDNLIYNQGLTNGDQRRSVFNSWKKLNFSCQMTKKLRKFSAICFRLITSVLTDRLDAWSIRTEAEKGSTFQLFISTDLFEFLISEMSRSRDLLKHDANVGVILLTTLRKCAHEYGVSSKFVFCYYT